VYNPRHFEESRPEVLRALVREHPFGALVVAAPEGFEVNHLPWQLVEGPGGATCLRGHVARANPIWRLASEPVPAVAIFRGAAGYVSPSAYASKAEHGRVVPTWNYQVVHAHGLLRAIDDAAWLREFVSALTARFEAERSPAWQVGDAPADYVEAQLRGIVGLELAVSRLEGKWKLGQNRSQADRDSMAAALEAEGGAAAELGATVREVPRSEPPR